MMLDLFGTLLLDEDGAGLEVLIIGVCVLLKGFQARQRLDLGLGGVIDAAVQIAVGMGWGRVGEKSMQHVPKPTLWGWTETIRGEGGRYAVSPS
jgi:hypothetical protein